MRCPLGLLLGSSPLARGTLAFTARRIASAGLIPARAGNTLRPVGRGFISRAHPRSRGEHTTAALDEAFNEGSSPLARGTLHAAIHADSRGGLIPARAGNTWVLFRGAPPGGAHPRSRGEHDNFHGYSPFLVGSSPLARGTLLIPGGDFVFSGLIPARAGNTRPCRWSYRPSRAHPRSRGEHDGRWSAIDGRTGSSPLARGTPNVPVHPTNVPGLIPARAGNTVSPAMPSRRKRAHPRSRGEHCWHANPCRRAGGSSPLARGTLLCCAVS